MNFAIAAGGGVEIDTATASATQHRKLTEAAQQFEGMLLQEMLKPMREHGFAQDDGEDKAEGGGFADTLSSFGTESVATAIAKGGGLGIAKRVVEQVDERDARRSGASDAPGPTL